MAALWNDLKKGVSNLASKAAVKASEITREAADKAEEMTKLGKVKLDIFQLKRDIDKKMTELGQTVYALLNETEEAQFTRNEKVKAIVEDIKALELKVKEKENQYQQIKEAAKTEKPKQTPAESQ